VLNLATCGFYLEIRLPGVALGAILVLSGPSVARAADWQGDCDRRIAHEQRELDHAIAQHGYWSRQAQHERRELDRFYAQCRDRYR
jgi:hypothetical protein